MLMPRPIRFIKYRAVLLKIPSKKIPNMITYVD